MSAVVEQERHVELVAGTSESFVITTRMVSASIPADLPHLNVFAVTVVDPLDPTQDTLFRVATIADLSLVPIGRDAGIAAPGSDGVARWLSSSWEARYGDLETALAGAQAFRDRINALITDWENFRTNFSAPDPTPAFYTLPVLDTSQLTTLIAAYKAAKQDRYQKQLTKTAADGVLATAQSDFTYKQTLVSGATTISSQASRVSLDVGLVVPQFGVLLGAGDAFYAANTGGSGAAAFQAALVVATNQEVASLAFPADATALTTSTTSYLLARQSDATASSTTLSAATSSQIAAAQALTAALALEASTLAAVLVICPTFDSHSVPLLDG